MCSEFFILFHKQKLRIKGNRPGVLGEVLRTMGRRKGPPLHTHSALMWAQFFFSILRTPPHVSWAFRLTPFVTTPVLSSVIKGPLSICNLHLSNFGHKFCKSLIAYFSFMHLLVLPPLSEAHHVPLVSTDVPSLWSLSHLLCFILLALGLPLLEPCSHN